MYEDLLRVLRCCPDAEYGCSRCKFKDSLHCRETLMQESADAIEKLKEELADKPKWISVKDRLPEDKAFVLCKCRAGIYEVLSWIGASWYHDTNHCYMKGFVTHWMSLPEPPKEGGETDGN